MLKVTNFKDLDYMNIPFNSAWNDADEHEALMHTIHAYPAKFPAFIAKKAFEYAAENGVNISAVADIFCGCGTVALEARLHNYDFWGCDINPVATLIARVKSNDYDIQELNKYFDKICTAYFKCVLEDDVYSKANPRLQYWYTENNYRELLKLYTAITLEVDCEKYLEAFECLFSAILKACSKWLMKSIKPQIDPNKKEIDVFKKFVNQYKKFLVAVKELDKHTCAIDIQCGNFLELGSLPSVDLIVTSPPYVTSYEYADIHQLSSLWLNYTDDYRKLRKGTIGSIYDSENFQMDYANLNDTARDIVQKLVDENKITSKVRSIARYFSDMQNVVKKCNALLKRDGMVLFVIGDTEYNGVVIQNSRHLIESMENSGFEDIKITKRIISKGVCVPYRDEKGKFSKNKFNKQIYHEEFIITGRKGNE